MAKKFTDFNTREKALTGDFLVGYKEDGSEELKITTSNLLSSYIVSNSTLVPFSSSVKNIVVISQSDYDSIPVKDPNILYFTV